jgi:hypothetical protein
MEMDRQLQRNLLEAMRDAHPHGIDFRPAPGQRREYASNLVYLAEHGLCESGVTVGADGTIDFGRSHISTAGLAFMPAEGDRMLEYDAAEIRDMIGAAIDRASIPAELKSALRQHLAALSEAGLTAMVIRLMEAGIRDMPVVVLAAWLHIHAGATAPERAVRVEPDRG